MFDGQHICHVFFRCCAVGLVVVLGACARGGFYKYAESTPVDSGAFRWTDAGHEDSGDAGSEDSGVDAGGFCLPAVGGTSVLGEFRPGPALSSERVDLAAAVAGSTAYFLGGYNPEDRNTGVVDTYSVATQQFTTEPAMPYGVSEFPAVLVSSAESIVVIAGDITDDVLDLTAEVFSYHYPTQRWSALPPLPRPRFAHGAAVAPDCAILVVGGFSSSSTAQGQHFSEVLEYRMGEPSWRHRTDLPTPRSNPTVVAAADGWIYVFGGHIRGGQTSDVVEAYHPATQAWRTVNSMPSPRTQAAAVLGPNGAVYIVGGREDTQALDEVLRFDPTSGAFSTLNVTLPLALFGVAAVVIENQLVVAGGHDAAGNYLATSYIADFITP